MATIRTVEFMKDKFKVSTLCV